VATTDFFMPVVDDPTDFGRIAAANALSDIYAMGATPLFALAIVGMPVNVLPAETIGAILAGGASVCAEAGVPVAGGHSIDSVEPIYGLVALGVVRPDRVMTNRAGRAGDALILGKALGVGVLSAAFKQEKLHAAGYQALIASTTQLNAVGPELAAAPAVHAMTDVTGFGLMGHSRELALGSGVAIEIVVEAVPRIEGALDAVHLGAIPAGLLANREFAECVSADAPGSRIADDVRALLYDPQTAGGLLISVAPDHADAILGSLRGATLNAAKIGSVRGAHTVGQGAPAILLR
jgi:selenide,water dikinase